jgi:hypothetical protein
MTTFEARLFMARKYSSTFRLPSESLRSYVLTIVSQPEQRIQHVFSTGG